MRNFIVSNIKQTYKLARRFSCILSNHDIVGFCGRLGSGKTTFIKVVAECFGIPKNNIISGSFVILNQYQAKFPIYHVDLYRLNSSQIPDEIYEIISDKNGLVLIEWADRLSIPSEYFKVQLDFLSLNSRKITIDADGNNLKKRLNKI